MENIGCWLGLLFIPLGLIVYLFRKKGKPDKKADSKAYREPIKPRVEVVRPFGGWKGITDQARFDRSLRYKPIDGTLDIVNECCLMEGSNEEPYEVSLYSCTCKDFTVNRGGSLLSMPLPCKHMYALVTALGYIRIHWIELQPLSLPDYHCDSGGFMSMTRYAVRASGINPATKRKNTRHIHVEFLDEVEKELERQGLVEPFEIVEVHPGFSPPTEAQFSYASRLCLYIPEGATKVDVSAMIDRVVSGNNTPPSRSLVEKLLERRIPFSRMSNHNDLTDYYNRYDDGRVV